MNIENLTRGKAYPHPHGHFKLRLIETSDKIKCDETRNFYRAATFKPMNLPENMQFMKEATFTYLFWQQEDGEFISFSLKD